MFESSFRVQRRAFFGDGITTITGRPSSISAIGRASAACSEPLGVHVCQSLSLSAPSSATG